MRRIPALVLLAFVALVLAAGPAWAHTELVDTAPADGASVKPGGDTVTLTFTREVDPRLATIDVRQDAGTVSEGRPQSDGPSLVQAVEDMAPGRYDVEWRAAADDGHVLQGAFAFRVAEDGGQTTEAAGNAGSTPKRLTPAELLREHAKGNYDHDAVPSYAAGADDSAPATTSERDTSVESSSPAAAPVAAPPAADDSSGTTIVVLLVAAVSVTVITAAAEGVRRG